MSESHPSITCLGRQFLRKMWPVLLAFLLFTVCRIFLSSWLLVLFATLHSPHDRSSWFSPSVSITTFQSFPFISDLRSDVSNFQHHATLYCKYSTDLVSSLNLSPVCWWKESSPSSWMLLLLWQFGKGKRLISRASLPWLSILSSGYQDSFPGEQSGQHVMQTNHIYQILRLLLCGVTSAPPFAFMARCFSLPRVSATADGELVQSNQKVSVHLMITVQKTRKHILNSFNHLHDNVARIRDNRWR
jgi:hypothetical protein